MRKSENTSLQRNGRHPIYQRKKGAKSENTPMEASQGTQRPPTATPPCRETGDIRYTKGKKCAKVRTPPCRETGDIRYIKRKKCENTPMEASKEVFSLLRIFFLWYTGCRLFLCKEVLLLGAAACPGRPPWVCSHFLRLFFLWYPQYRQQREIQKRGFGASTGGMEAPRGRCYHINPRILIPYTTP